MMKLAVCYAAALIAFLAIDTAWLVAIAKNFYQSQIGQLLAPSPNLAAAGLFYLMYIAAVIFFAVWPALQSGSVGKAALYGALFGLCAYGTYDLTNLATLKDWPVTLVLVDMAWGTFSTGVAATGVRRGWPLVVPRLAGPILPTAIPDASFRF